MPASPRRTQTAYRPVAADFQSVAGGCRPAGARCGDLDISPQLLGCRTHGRGGRFTTWPIGRAPEAGGGLVFGPVLEAELFYDHFQQGILLEHFGLRLDVDRVVRTGSGGWKYVAQVQEILIDALNLNGCLRTVQARLDGADQSRGEHAEGGDAAQGGLAPVERPNVFHDVPLPAAGIDRVNAGPNRTRRRGRMFEIRRRIPRVYMDSHCLAPSHAEMNSTVTP